MLIEIGFLPDCHWPPGWLGQTWRSRTIPSRGHHRHLVADDGLNYGACANTLRAWHATAHEKKCLTECDVCNHRHAQSDSQKWIILANSLRHLRVRMWHKRASPIPRNRDTQRDELVYGRKAVKSIDGPTEAHKKVLLWHLWYQEIVKSWTQRVTVSP